MKKNRFNIMRPLFAITLLLVVIWACSDSYSERRFDSEDEMLVYGYVQSRADLSTFKALCDYTQFYSLLSTAGNFTVFIPTNEAFEKLFKNLRLQGEEITKIEDKTVEYWLDYIEYHTIEAKINSNSFENSALSEPTLLGEDYYIVSDTRESYSKIKLNSRSTIIEYNIEVANGIVDIIDEVLLPPTKSTYEMLKESGDFTKMLAIFEETNLTSYLTDSTTTLLITPDSILEKNGFDKTNIADLEIWAKYHIFYDIRQFAGQLDGFSVYPLYKEEAISFTVDDYGRLLCNEDFKCSNELINGVDNLSTNGVYHVLDTTLTIIEATPGIRIHNLYGSTSVNPAGDTVYKQNVFSSAPATITEDAGTKSFHQGLKPPIASFNAYSVGDYFEVTIPDVVKGKYEVKMVQRHANNRCDLMMVYNGLIANREIKLKDHKTNYVNSYWKYVKCGTIEVSSRGDVELLFQVTYLRRSSSSCCDCMMDAFELHPVE